MDLITTFQILGNLGEFVGAIAVVATLAFLAVEVRHSRQSLDANTNALAESRRLARAQAYQARSQMSQDYFLRVAESEYIADIADKIRTQGWDSLAEEEKWRYEIAQRAIFARIDNAHYQYAQGYLDEDLYNAMMSEAAPFARFWKYLGILQGGRKQFIEDLMATLPDEKKRSDDEGNR